MKKQVYVKPEVKVVITESVQMFATSNAAAINLGGGDGNTNGGTAVAESQGRRGAWGDLWN